MTILLQDLHTVVEDVLSTIFGMAPVPRDIASSEGKHDEWMVSRIEIHGVWAGELAVTCGPALAATLASSFFGEKVAVGQLEDASAAMLELTNILAGHVNSMMEAPSRISMPQMATGMDTLTAIHTNAPELVTAYSCDGENILVTLRDLTTSQKRGA